MLVGYKNKKQPLSPLNFQWLFFITIIVKGQSLDYLLIQLNYNITVTPCQCFGKAFLLPDRYNLVKYGGHFFAYIEVEVERAEVPVHILNILHKLLKICVERSYDDVAIRALFEYIFCNGRRFVS